MALEIVNFGRVEIAPEPTTQYPWGSSPTPYEEIGGDAVVRSLVERFYDLIEEESPHLRAMLPKDTSTSRQKLYEFLSGWLGGPPLYTERRGHPKLRLRHMPFDIGTPEAEEWMRCMRKAIASIGIEDRLASFLDAELDQAAQGLRNRPDPGVIVPTVSPTRHISSPEGGGGPLGPEGVPLVLDLEATEQDGGVDREHRRI